MSKAEETKKWRIENKICVKCGKEPALPDNQKGAICKAKAKAAQDKILNERRGKCCLVCGKESGGKAYCPECDAKQDKSRDKRRKARFEARVCTECGKNTPTGDNKVCDPCIASRSKTRLDDYHAKVEARICGYGGCQNPVEGDHSYCPVHLEKQSRDGQSLYQWCLVNKVCCFCPDPKPPALPNKPHCAACHEKAKQTQKLVNRRRKMRVLKHYGMTCVCCGCGLPDFLQIDHIDGGGTKHHRELGLGRFYLWLIKNGFPPGYQTLCGACNAAKRDKTHCPHQDLPATVLLQLRQAQAVVTAAWREQHPEDFEVPPKGKPGRKRKS